MPNTKQPEQNKTISEGKQNKLLNQLIDEMEYIELNAYGEGISDKLGKKNVYDKRLANHKTKAFKIINDLKLNSEKPKMVKDKLGDSFTKFLEGEGYEVVTVKDVEKEIKKFHKDNKIKTSYIGAGGAEFIKREKL